MLILRYGLPNYEIEINQRLLKSRTKPSLSDIVSLPGLFGWEKKHGNMRAPEAGDVLTRRLTSIFRSTIWFGFPQKNLQKSAEKHVSGA